MALDHKSCILVVALNFIDKINSLSYAWMGKKKKVK